jgi:Brp/Blh family beta-carotene 15,15'-monooxygenase
MMLQRPSSPLIVLLKGARLLFPLAVLLSLVLTQQFPDLLTPIAQIAILGIVITLFGLPHGALDPWIAQQIGLNNTRTEVFIFNSLYLAMTVCVVLIWLWLPALSLGVFLFISAWHFSDDWSKSLNTPLRLSAGALLLLMPIGFHTEAVYSIFEQLSGQSGGALAASLALPAGFLTTAMIILVGVALWQKQWQSALEFISLFLLAYFTSPLLYFTLYFCLLHSPRHLSELFIAAPTLEHSRMLRMMLIYTLATLVLLGGLGWYWATLPTSTLILRLIFIGLAAVTVPHMLLIGAAFLKNRTKLSSF